MLIGGCVCCFVFFVDGVVVNFLVLLLIVDIVRVFVDDGIEVFVFWVLLFFVNSLFCGWVVGGLLDVWERLNFCERLLNESVLECFFRVLFLIFFLILLVFVDIFFKLGDMGFFFVVVK